MNINTILNTSKESIARYTYWIVQEKIWIGLCAVALYESVVFLSISRLAFDLPSLVVFICTVSLYRLHSRINAGSFSFRIGLFDILLSSLGFWFLIWSVEFDLLQLFMPFILVFGYYLLIIKGAKSIFYIFKPFLLAFSWMYIAQIWATNINGYDFPKSDYFYGCTFLWLSALCILFDQKDLYNDKNTGINSLNVVLRKTWVQMGTYVLVFLSCVCLYCFIPDWITILGFGLVFYIPFIFLIFVLWNQEKPYYFHIFGDSVCILFFASILLFMR